jgi:DNA polymerase delta subunit 2
MLVEYLAGEEGGPEEQVSSSQISRLIVAGNSLAAMPDNEPTSAERKAVSKKDIIQFLGFEIMNCACFFSQRRYGYDAASFSPHPTINLSAHLLDLCRVIPVHILPGATDPSGAILPQQPFPRAMFGQVASFTNFSCETNPTYLRLGCNAVTPKDNPPVERTFLINSGQPLNDMCKYLPSSRNTKLSMLEATLRWRHMAPTAPDTLWCHPYFAADPFLIHETPHFYIVGGQKRFATRLIVEKDRANGDGGEKRCRVVLVPEFAESGLMVLVNMRSLDVKTIKFSLQGMTGGE